MSTTPSYKILLVDDDRFLLDMYGMKFTQAGHTVQTCLSTAEAIQFLHDGFAADAVVFDLVMPVEDGFALLQKIKTEKLATGAALIALTNQGEEEKQKVQEMGGDAHIVKAQTVPSEVVHKVIEVIEHRKATSS